ncbi:VOC family protein [Devosia sp. SL43]|uniref:VOC family protein n=1 Tax=Devosia sp. SL43 TaxID=2806348 RepID=UPI001F2C072B|nr:VOC family protein [Devosia sp. SL43]UJW87459.1 VOC family protein [Devosia sp. SL43]
MSKDALKNLAPHHIGISVRSIDEAIAFWSDMFGFELDFRTEIPAIRAEIAFIKRNGFRIELFQIEGAAEVPQERLKPNTDLATHGTKHICFSVDDVQGALEHLHGRGVRIVGIMRQHGAPMQVEEDPRLSGYKVPARAFFFLDASNTLVEILRKSDFSD